MMHFRKLALAAAVAVVPTAGFSLETLDDSALSELTGQDGLTIDLTLTGAAVTARYLDTDGETGTSHPDAASFDLSADGALNIPITNLDLDTTVTVDVGGNANNSAGLIIGLDLTSLSVSLGAITVDNGDISTAGAGSYTILSGFDLTMAGSEVGILLGGGAEVTGADFVYLNGTVSGLTISNMEINDGSNALGITSLVLSDLVLDGTTVNLVDAAAGPGAALEVVTGASLTLDVELNGIYLDNGTDTNTIGSLGLYGLDLSGTTITISGH